MYKPILTSDGVGLGYRRRSPLLTHTGAHCTTLKMAGQRWKEYDFSNGLVQPASQLSLKSSLLLDVLMCERMGFLIAKPG